jgi:hypothetical protein
VPLGPTYQLVPPPSTVAVAHHQPPFPLPCSVGPRGHTAPPTLSPTGRDPGPPSLPIRSSMRHRTPRALHCPRPSEPPLIHTGDRATAALSGVFSSATVVVVPPPLVRPTNPPPFPDLEPPSPLSSSPAAPGTSRSHRQPSLRRGRRRTEPPLRPIIAPPPR